jgi:hypothetical protein
VEEFVKFKDANSLSLLDDCDVWRWKRWVLGLLDIGLESARSGLWCSIIVCRGPYYELDFFFSEGWVFLGCSYER